MNAKRCWKIPLGGIVVGFVLTLSVRGDPDPRSEAAEWETAARSRQATAASLEEQASELLRQAAEWRAKEYLYDTERRGNFSKAGDSEKKAGDCAEAAAANYRKEADNWLRAAAAHEAVPDARAGEKARAESGRALARAANARDLALAHYGLAAEAFSEDNAAEPEKAAAAVTRAARLREEAS